jgi:eukaryotic-like serine/threonine-protein kinase
MQRSRSSSIRGTCTPHRASIRARPLTRTLTRRVAAVPAPHPPPARSGQEGAVSDTLYAYGSDPHTAPPRAGTASAIDPGTVVGNYRVVELLATGGMGEVFRGEHVHLGRPVAIKFLHQRLIGNPEALARFGAEARAASRIRHPGVVGLLDFGPHQAGAYLVMELLAGETLTQRIAASGALSPDAAIDIGVQLADALAAAHANGVVHRDLKPDNVLLVADRLRPRGERAVLIDFGVAKLAAGLSAPLHTLHGDLLGTPFYMAPEQSVNAAAVDCRSDVYSLGCVLYRMLSGRVPFDGSLMDILLAHQRAAPPPLRAIDPAIPPELDALVAHMMAKAPRARPQDMSRVARTLDHIGARSREHHRRRVRTAWMGAAVAAALAVAGLGHLVLP